MDFEEKTVDAIEEGKIVKVSEEYAKQEGLIILRKSQAGLEQWEKPKVKKEVERARPLFDDFRKPLNWNKKEAIRDLVDNFHWEILRKRRAKGLTRRQVGKAIGESEEAIRMAENGIIEKGDYTLINKLEEYFGISLRKQKYEFGAPMRALIDKEIPRAEKKEEKKVSEEDKGGIKGNEIELVD